MIVIPKTATESPLLMGAASAKLPPHGSVGPIHGNSIPSLQQLPDLDSLPTPDVVGAEVRNVKSKLDRLTREIRSPLTTLSVNLIYGRAPVQVEHSRLINRRTGSTSQVVRVSVTHPGTFSLLVVPRLPTGKIGLTMRYRYAAKKWSLELPRIDDQDHDDGWRSPAERCLLDCTGLVAERFGLLGHVRIHSALSNSEWLIVMADGCRSMRATVRDDAALIGGWSAASPAAIGALIASGDIDCAATLAALTLFSTAPGHALKS